MKSLKPIHKTQLKNHSGEYTITWYHYLYHIPLNGWFLRMFSTIHLCNFKCLYLLKWYLFAKVLFSYKTLNFISIARYKLLAQEREKVFGRTCNLKMPFERPFNNMSSGEKIIFICYGLI